MVVLGGFNVPLPEWQYGLYDALALLALLGLVGYIVRPRWSRVGPVNRPALLLGLLWLSFTGAALIRFTQLTMGSQGRYLFPALPIIAVLVGWGLAGWLRAVARSRVTAGLVVVLVVGASLVPIAVIRPAHALSRRLAADQIGSIPHPVRVTFGLSRSFDDRELASAIAVQ